MTITIAVAVLAFVVGIALGVLVVRSRLAAASAAPSVKEAKPAKAKPAKTVKGKAQKSVAPAPTRPGPVPGPMARPVANRGPAPAALAAPAAPAMTLAAPAPSAPVQAAPVQRTLPTQPVRTSAWAASIVSDNGKITLPGSSNAAVKLPWETGSVVSGNGSRI